MRSLTYDSLAPPFLYPSRVQLELVSGVVRTVKIELGYGHKAAERDLSASPVALAINLSQMCGQHSVAITWAAYRAIEELSNQEVPFSAQCLRSIALEVERVMNHLVTLRNMAMGMSWKGGMWLTGKALVEAQRVASDLGGMPLGRRFVFGGFFYPDLDLDRLAGNLENLENVAKPVMELWVHHSSVAERLIGLAKLTAAQASDLGLVGPIARASGINSDVRLVDPFGAYHHQSPRVQPQGAGDAFARVVVMASEVMDSIRLARGFLHELPAEAVAVPAPLKLTSGLRAARVEGSDGETVAVISVGHEKNLEAAHLRPGSAANVAALRPALQGVRFEDWALAYLSLGICPTCVDR
jgi:ech hydrogenase subunit E